MQVIFYLYETTNSPGITPVLQLFWFYCSMTPMFLHSEKRLHLDHGNCVLMVNPYAIHNGGPQKVEYLFRPQAIPLTTELEPLKYINIFQKFVADKSTETLPPTVFVSQKCLPFVQDSGDVNENLALLTVMILSKCRGYRILEI